ncbi:hypothetical protein D3C76_1075090 [compost metagenome]
MLARQVGEGIEAGHGVGADALEIFGQQREIGVHALGTKVERYVERRLVLVERGIGGALQLVRRADHVRQEHRFAEAVPEAAQGKQPQQASEQISKKRKTGCRGHGQAVWEQSGACYLYLSRAWCPA